MAWSSLADVKTSMTTHGHLPTSELSVHRDHKTLGILGRLETPPSGPNL
jgi:hypothetical protein